MESSESIVITLLVVLLVRGLIDWHKYSRTRRRDRKDFEHIIGKVPQWWGRR